MDGQRRGARGQVIVIVAIALVVLIAMVGMVLDGGFAWALERHTQNGADAAARSGAAILARRAAEEWGGTPVQTPAQWGEEVRNAVFGSAVHNDVLIQSATYTDWQGTLLGVPVDGQAPPAGAAGVAVEAKRIFDTHLVRVLGINRWTIVQDATAVSGPTLGCPETIYGCILLPVTFPVTVLACGPGNTSVPEEPAREWESGVELTIPLCGGNPGSVGWIDWEPPFGGSSDLEDDILHPINRNVPLPSWQYITETGDTSAGFLEDALNTYAGKIVLFPLFDSTCNIEPTNNQTSGCPDENVGGNGVNQWYHLSHFLAFRLSYPKGAFINGNYLTSDCASVNAHECVKGAFVDLISEGGVCPPEGCPDQEEPKSFTVQLIK